MSPRVVLDSGGISALADERARLRALLLTGEVPVVPAVVLVEVLTGDHRRDYRVNRLLECCRMIRVDARLARSAARLRSATRRAGSISATDALVVAIASELGHALILTSDPDDIAALADQQHSLIDVARV